MKLKHTVLVCNVGGGNDALLTNHFKRGLTRRSVTIWKYLLEESLNEEDTLEIGIGRR